MSNSIVSSVSSAALPHSGPRFSALQNTPRAHGRDRDSDGGSPGLNLFSALLQALVAAATQSSSTAAASSSASTATSGTAAGTGTTTAATSSSATTSGSSSTLPQDLGAFLHDLFHALRQADRQAVEGRHLVPLSSSTSDSNQTVPTAGTGSVPATSSTATSSVPAAGGVATSSSASPSSGSTPTSSTPPVNVAAGNYREQGIIGALQQLISDFANSQVVSGAPSSTTASGGVSQNVLSKLNSAFQRLIADLGGTSSASGSPSDTTALQSFLAGFLQDLQNGHPSNSSGNLINVAA